MRWATVAPIILRTDWEASPAAASLFQLCLRRAEWLSAVRRRLLERLPAPPRGSTGRGHSTRTHRQRIYLHLGAGSGESALLPTGGSREIAPRDSTIKGWDVIYEKRLAKADPSS